MVKLKPYPAYKDSGVPWLGRVPAHWHVLPARAMYEPKCVKNSGMRERTVLSLSYGRIVVRPEDRLHGLVPESFETYQIIDPGDIVVRTTDLQNDRTSLRIAQSSHRGIVTSAYLCLKTRVGVLPEFGYQMLNMYDLTKVIYGYGSGLRQSFGFEDIKRMPVLVPPLAEQRAVVAFLSRVDRQVRRYTRAKQKQIALLNEHKQAIIHRAVTRGLDPNVSLKPSGVRWLGEIPDHWEVWRVGHFAVVGNGSTPSRSNAAYWEGGSYPWLNSASVNRNPICKAEQFVTDLALAECHLPRVQPGSVLVAITGQGKTRGTSAVLAIEATINQHVAYITPRRNVVTAEYLQLAFVGAYQELRAISDNSGSTKSALTCGDIENFKVALPPLTEQAEILSRVRQETQAIDRLIEHTETQLNLLQEYRTRLIADVVTGKLDVQEASTQLPISDDESDPLDGAVDDDEASDADESDQDATEEGDM